MRIVIICSRLGYGGAERVAVLWANCLVKKGHEVFLVSSLQEDRTYQVDKRVKLCNLFANSHNKIKKWGSAIINIRKIAKKECPDVIIGVMEICSLVAKISLIGLGIPIIMTAHNTFERPLPTPMSRREFLLKFYINRIYQHVTVLTTSDKEFIGNRLRRVSVMPNPLLLAPVTEIPLKERVILAAGRLDDWHYKGFDVLIKAFSKLVQGYGHSGHDFCHDSSKQASLMAFAASKIQSEGWKLQIAGTGSEESLNYLKGLCKENGVEDYVEFLGFQKDIEKLYQKASIFVLSSRYEGFGLVLIEAMSQGCACIACDYKGRQKEILRNLTPNPSPKGEGELPTEGSGAAEPETPNSKLETPNSELGTRNSHVELCETGILCEPDDVDALAEAMRKMMTDDDYRESVRMKAVERSEFYSLENTTRRWEELLEKVVKKGVS